MKKNKINRMVFAAEDIKNIISLFIVVLWINSCGKWPDIVNSKADIESLPLNTTSVRARGLSDDNIPALVRLQSLMHIYFDDGWAVEEAKITDKGLQYLSELKLPLLEHIMLGYCYKITDSGLQYLSKIKTLKGLGLRACTGITDRGLPHLVNLSSLEWLDLRESANITDTGIMTLANMKNLKDLLLGGCKNVSPEGIKRLQALMPNCKVG
jgi:hypothetical protein